MLILNDTVQNFIYLTKNKTDYRHQVLVNLINNPKLNQEGRIFVTNLLSMGNTHFSIFKLSGNVIMKDESYTLIQKVLKDENLKLNKTQFLNYR